MFKGRPFLPSSNACTDFFIGLPRTNPRLLIPLTSSRIQASSFALYSPGSFRGKLFKWFGQLAGASGLLKLAGRCWAAPLDSFPATDNIQPLLDHVLLGALQGTWEGILGKGPLAIALSLGTPGHYRKVTALVFDQQAMPLAFAKVGCTPQAGRLIANERSALATLGSMTMHGAIIPALLGHGTTGPASWLLQSALLTGSPSPLVLQKAHFDFLADIAKATMRRQPLHTTGIGDQLQSILKKPVLSIASGFEAGKPFITELIRGLRASGIEEMEKSWPTSAAHGDFAPWNMRLAEGRLAMFDWEYFLPEAPAGWDLLQFLFRVDHLIRRKTLEQMWSEFQAGSCQDVLDRWEKLTGLQIPDRQFLAAIVLLAIACDLVPRWICGEEGEAVGLLS